MRIAFISASRIPSRTANSIEVMKVCQAFLDAGHEVRLWAPEVATEMTEEALRTWYGLKQAIPIVRIQSIPLFRRYDFCWRAVGQASSWGPDLVYCWPIQAAYFSTLRGLPTAIEIHDRPYGRIAPRLLRSVLASKHTLRVLPITQAMANWLAARYPAGFDPGRTVVSPMGVDLERYQDLPGSEEARAQLGLPPGFTAGYTGHLYPGRGLELMQSLARLNPQVRFLWVGGEPAAVDAWRVRLVQAGIGNVHLAGFVPNEALPLYQAACDVLLMPYQEAIAGSSGGDTARFASPMKVFEYMASGRPILSSDLPVLREVLDEFFCTPAAGW